MQKSLHAAVDWFPISTAECIGLMLNPKTNALNKAGAIGLVFETYYDQIRSAANMESQSAATSDLNGCKNCIAKEIEECIFMSLTRMTARLICVLATILI